MFVKQYLIFLYLLLGIDVFLYKSAPFRLKDG